VRANIRGLNSILVVEDDRAAQFALSELLGDLGVKLQIAQSGEDALRLVLKHQFAAILLDVRLPGIDGYEVAAAIRSLERSRRTPIIFMSAEEDRRTRSRHGDDDLYLRKPLEPDVIRPAVAQCIARSAA
jgi:CheY-like chemotaxis protein